jgi:hypothetical protein
MPLQRSRHGAEEMVLAHDVADRPGVPAGMDTCPMIRINDGACDPSVREAIGASPATAES